MKIIASFAFLIIGSTPGLVSAQATVDCRGNSQAKPCVEFRENGHYDGPLKIITNQPESKPKPVLEDAVSASIQGVTEEKFNATSTSQEVLDFSKFNGLPCSEYWQACSSNFELMENFNDFPFIAAECQVKAESLSRFGDIDWDGFFYIPFGTSLPGRTGLEKGILTLVEPNAMVPNRFGGREKTMLACLYDLDLKKIVSLEAL